MGELEGINFHIAFVGWEWEPLDMISQSLFKVNTHQGCLVLPAFIPFNTIKYWGDAGDQEARRSHSPVRCPGAKVVV